VGVTCAASIFSVLEENVFPIVFLDECSQMLEPMSLLPLGRYGCQKMIAVGDPMQLPPQLRTGSAEDSGTKGECGLEKTIFLRLAALGYTPIMLRTQYRCHPSLSGLASELFYNHKLKDGILVGDRSALVPNLPAILLCNADRGNEKSDKDNSYYNDVEATLVVQIISILLERGVPGGNIGVICWYKAQVKRVLDLLKKQIQANNSSNNGVGKGTNRIDIDRVEGDDDKSSGKSSTPTSTPTNFAVDEDLEMILSEEDLVIDEELLRSLEGEKEGALLKKTNDEIQVSTVDAFQGAEKEVIIMTCSRTKHLGFIDNPNRLNVSLTRAKRHLFIVAQQEILNSSEGWRAIIRHVKRIPGGVQSGSNIILEKKFSFDVPEDPVK